MVKEFKKHKLPEMRILRLCDIHDYSIISITGYNIPQRAITLQYDVFKHFGYNIIQLPIIGKISSHSHADAIDNYLKEYKKKFILIFDADAIPINNKLIPFLLKSISDNNTLCGMGQGHWANFNRTYVGPACCALSIDLYNKIGRPSFRHTNRIDVGGELTLATNLHKFKVKYMLPTHVEQPTATWRIGSLGKYGYGTTYDNMLYHGWAIRKGADRFIRRCEEILRIT
jgi:hypothetical protein